jgi:hypothetical protein
LNASVCKYYKQLLSQPPALAAAPGGARGTCDIYHLKLLLFVVEQQTTSFLLSQLLQAAPVAPVIFII